MRDALTTGLELVSFVLVTAGLIVGLGVLAGCLVAGGLGGLAVAWIVDQ